MAEAKAETMQQEREEVYAALHYAASFHCLVEQWKNCEELRTKPKEKWVFSWKRKSVHRMEWCAEADRYRCMRCGRGSKYMKKPGKCTGPILLSNSLENAEDDIWEGHDLTRRMDRQGEVLIWRRKCSGYVRQRMGPKLMSCCKLEPVGTQGHGKMLKRIPSPGRWWGSSKGCKNTGGSKDKREELQGKSIRGF